MSDKNRFFHFSTHSKSNSMMFLGIGLFLIGLVILVFPKILIIFISTIFMMTGLGMIFHNWNRRQVARSGQETIRIRWFE